MRGDTCACLNALGKYREEKHLCMVCYYVDRINKRLLEKINAFTRWARNNATDRSLAEMSDKN